MRLPMSFVRKSTPENAGELGLALAASASATVYLISGLTSAQARPGGLEGALENDALFRILLVRIVTALAFGAVGTVLLVQRRAVGGLVLIATAVASSLTIPSAMWIASATLYSIAGALALRGALPLLPSEWRVRAGTPRARRSLVAFGVLCVLLAGLGLVPTLLSYGIVGADGLVWPYVALWAGQAGIIAVALGMTALIPVNRAGQAIPTLLAALLIGSALTVIGAPDGIVSIYARVPGAVPTRRSSGDPAIPIPTPEPELGLTPIPAQTTLTLAPAAIRLAPGETAVISLNVTTDTPVQSLAFDLGFDPQVLAVQEVTGGAAMADWASVHGAAVVTLSGVENVSPPGLRALGVALVSADADEIGPSGGGTLAVFTIRARQVGVTQLRLQAPIVRSRVDGRNRRHPLSNSSPTVQIVVG